jgi:hypothetical protein
MPRINRLKAALGASVAGMAMVLAPVAAAQSAPGFTPPKTAWGAPDLQGMWSNASITDLQRDPRFPNLVLTPEQAEQMREGDYYINRTREDSKQADVNNLQLLDGSDLLSGGGYNAFWVDQGNHIATVKGELRSSWIVEPSTGRIPRLGARAAAEAAAAAAAAAPTGAARAGGQTVQGPGAVDPNAGGGFGSYNNPETRPMGERCLIGFGNTGGPVMNNVLYNNTYQFVQAPDHVVIVVEMVHDARIIPLTKDRKRPDVIKPWLGDSIGWYEGDTLVVETRNVHPQQRGYISENGVLVERFSRWSENEIVYEFTVTDPTLYSQPWKGEMAFWRSHEPQYEYACHEGNYAMEGILAGARKQEREGQVVAANADEEGR